MSLKTPGELGEHLTQIEHAEVELARAREQLVLQRLLLNRLARTDSIMLELDVGHLLKIENPEGLPVLLSFTVDDVRGRVRAEMLTSKERMLVLTEKLQAAHVELAAAAR